MARHAAVPSSISNGFDLGGMACCIQHSVFDVVCVCARVWGWRDGSGAMFLGAVFCMQGRRRCILDGVAFIQRSADFGLDFISHNSSRLMAIDAHVGFICGLVHSSAIRHMQPDAAVHGLV